MTTHRGGAGNYAENTQRAAEAGRKGGKARSGTYNNNPERAVEAGRKGGAVSRRGKAQENRVQTPVQS